MRQTHLVHRPSVSNSSERRSVIRVSFLIDKLTRAGTENQLLALIRCLDRSVVEPSLVLLDGEDETSRSLEPGCPVIRLGVRKLFGLRAAHAAVRLRRFWKQQQPDVVQVYFLDSAYFGIPSAKLCGIRHVVRVRNNLGYWLTRKHRLLNRLLRPAVNVTLTNSESGRDALVKADGLAGDQVVVIENGVDVPGSITKGTSVVGCVANLRPVKNITGLLRAAKIVLARFPHWRFELAGEGDQRMELEALRDALGLGDRFVFRGSVADVPVFLRTVSVAVLPSLSEGMSNAVLEYMAAGKAVIATDVGANRIVLGDTGVIVSPGDESSLANAISELIASPGRVEALGSAARARAEEHYGRAAMARRFEAFYWNLVNTRSERHRVWPTSPGSLSGRAGPGSPLRE
ncbi:MAG TPA: glycosyltransferase [Fimbriiglobus sp.]|jgi:glycosyltransferase involved in cell wall biosynthesis